MNVQRNNKGQFVKGHATYGKKHGMFGTRFYFCYFSMKQRCEDKNSTSFSRYGAKGIKLHWETFLDFKRDMYVSYLQHVKEFGERQTTIDRVNNAKGYSKENCRWATYKEQGNNNSRVRIINFRGKKLSITGWAEETGLRKELIATRLGYGWTIDKVLSKTKFNRYDNIKKTI